MQNLHFVNTHFPVQDLQLEIIKDGHIKFWSNISEGIDIYHNEKGIEDSINMIGSAWNMKAYRCSALDVETYAKEFAQGPNIGNPSPYEVISEKINDANISIDYRRPSLRGRKIYSHILPYGEVQRTAAGAPAIITLDKNISIWDHIIKSGTYNLYTIPDTKDWTLTFNTEDIAWGSIYHPDYDVIHIPMMRSILEIPVDKFVINTSKTGHHSGQISMSWEHSY